MTSYNTTMLTQTKTITIFGIRISAFFAVMLSVLCIKIVSAQEGFEVREIIFSGNQTLSSSVLEEQISMHTVSWFNRVILGKDIYWFDQNSLEIDLEALRYFYHTEGFLNVAIDADLNEIDWDDQHLTVVFSIIESLPVKVDKTHINIRSDSSETPVSDQEQIADGLKQLTLSAGTRFRDNDLKSDRQRLISYYVNRGFPYVEVGHDLSLKSSMDSVDIEWQVITGPECTFGEIQILGNQVVAEKSIREQLSFNEGELFQQQLIDTSHRDVYSLGMFKAVSMHAVLEREVKTAVPIKVEVREASGLISRFGAGFGTEEKFRAFVDLTRLGFFGNTRRLSLFLKHSTLEPYHINLEFTQPAFLHPRASLQLNPYLRRQDEPGYKVSKMGARASLIYDFSQRILSSFSYIYENVTQDTVSAQKNTGESTYDKKMFVLNFSADRTLPRFDPDRGNYIGVNLKVNGFIFKTPLPFTKILLEYRRFQEFYGMVLGLRFKIGSIKPTQANEFIPVEERFYSGGSNSIRGWSRAELGPLDAEGLPTGGNSLLESSFEFRVPLSGAFASVYFLDLGNVWEPSFYYRLNELRYSAGVGLRYATFIGPVRLDVARPIFDEVRTWQIHFSVGHAF